MKDIGEAVGAAGHIYFRKIAEVERTEKQEAEEYELPEALAYGSCVWRCKGQRSYVDEL
jgi:hypothetical protein